MRAAVVQFAAVTDVDENVELIRRLVATAADARPDLVVLPEAAMHDFGPPDLELGWIAQPIDGPFVGELCRLARKYSAALVAGMFEVAEDRRRPYNTLAAVSPSGELLAAYRKTHLYDSFGYRESDRLSAGGGEPLSIRVEALTVGLMTCYDLRFPEFGRALVDIGSDAFVVPSAWVRGPMKEDHWSTLLRARAIENTVYVAAAAQTGRTYCGGSMIIDPMGVVRAALGDEQGVVTAELTHERIAAVRERNPSLANRRL